MQFYTIKDYFVSFGNLKNITIGEGWGWFIDIESNYNEDPFPFKNKFISHSYNHVCIPLTINEMIPPAGQGTIAIQKRVSDQKMSEICNKINHISTWYLSQAEREFLAYFDASCRTPISAYADYIDTVTIRARYMYGDFEGSSLKFCTETGPKTDGKRIATRAAKIIESK